MFKQTLFFLIFIYEKLKNDGRENVEEEGLFYFLILIF